MSLIPFVAGPVQPEWRSRLDPQGSPEGSERTCRLNFHTSIRGDGRVARFSVALAAFADQVKGLTNRGRAHELEVFAVSPEKRHGATGRTSKNHVSFGLIRQHTDLFEQVAQNDIELTEPPILNS